MVIFAVLAIFTFIIFLQSKIYERSALKGLEYSIRVSAHEVFEGDEIEIIESVSNLKTFPIPWIKIELAVSRWLEFSGTEPDVISGLRFVPSIFMLWGHRRCTRAWKVRCLKRGVYRLDDIRLYSSDFFGLCSSSTLISANEEIVVLPIPCEQLIFSFHNDLLWGITPVLRFIADDPFSISGVREYRDEPISRIHWPSTAKTGEIVVYNTEYTTHNHILYLINFQFSEFGELAPAADSFIESSIKAVVWFLEKAKSAGIETTIITNSANDSFRASGKRYMSDLSYLARLKNECSESFSSMMENLDISPYTDILVFTSFISKNIADAAKRYCAKRDIGVKNLMFYCNASDEDIKCLGDGKIIPLNRSSKLFVPKKYGE
ncbi:MAG: DUF58 domain-containing protein [Eubacterium sp.]|jgi:hypothetical protein|nr:DUF58 domain-containing protein [Eubacterium sp.]